ncbi:hypothetical protein NA56DRAFT_446468 [Hyaloscypha hepaticicola]|uniref:Fe2OG dioxygenase domain-containing protein n=1 Tax=Hyaloscypha hepaticicola TaxID=2082293 RepID=A0A2J6PG47_9HELO|nr:hypothetical protein NA56DRAFT_446468 [Hyaloscypha hepaticicola]
MTDPTRVTKRKRNGNTNNASQPKQKKQQTQPAQSVQLTQQPEAYYGNQTGGKPEPFGKPLFHAEKRQQLCETLDWYRAYQSGAYTNEGIAYGILCDKEVGERDYFGDQVIITRVGGGKEADKQTGKMVQVTSQTDSRFAKAFLKSKQIVKPIGVIAGQGNHGCPTALPHYYCPLDWFHATDVWCENYNGLSRWMVRLEKINLDEKSWWSAKATPHTPPDFNTHKAEVKECPKCKKESKVIYKQGWTCLNADPVAEKLGVREKTTCTGFFKFGSDVNDKTLEYTEQYLLERTNFKELRDPSGLEVHTGPLKPRLPTMEDVETLGNFGFEEKCKRGVVCPLCGCCSRRVEWGRWICESSTSNGHFEYSLPARIITADESTANGNDIPRSLRTDPGEMHKDVVDDIIDRLELDPPEHEFGYKIYRYGIPDETPVKTPDETPDETAVEMPKETSDGKPGAIIGYVYHLKPNANINQQPEGADGLFEDLQRTDLGLKRNPSRHNKGVNEVLTAHWATNWGAPYKYRVAQESRPFKDAPSVIISAITQLSSAGKKSVALGGEAFGSFNEFNEMLSVGYFEGSHMGWHDDGEKTLGPTVASMSLGCSSVMQWRPKAKAKICGKTKANNKKQEKVPVLKILLEHGDIMIMHGAKIQQLYEHEVKPCGKLRFALTCRYIDPTTLSGEERAYAEKAGELP